MTTQRLLYVLPVYNPDSDEHLYHLYGFIDDVARSLDVLVLVERARGTVSMQNARVYVRRVDLPGLRVLETLLVMLYARLRGCRRFYSHYSMSAAILSGLVTRLLGGISYYWSCGHMMDYVPKEVHSFADLRVRLRNQGLLGLTLRLVHHLVTGNQTMAHYYSENYRLKLDSIRVMPNWVDLERFDSLPEKKALRQRLQWPAEKQVILFLHRLAERKGAQYIVPIAQETLAQLGTAASQLHFVVAGGGPYLRRLEEEIREAQLSDHVDVMGAVPNREAIRCFAASDLYFMPSTEEGFPRTLLEAMAARCPFVASDIGGVRDLLTPAQERWLVPRGDWRAMASALVHLLSDVKLRQQLADEGWTHVQQYGQDRVVQAFTEMVRQ